MKVILFYIVSFITFFTSSVNANDSIEEALCKVDMSIELNLPKLVLVGTNVITFDSFQPSFDKIAEHYSAEIGGATLTLSIIPDSKNTQIKRTFQEPDEPIYEQLYDSVCMYENTIYAPNLIGKLVTEGLLILEIKPNVDEISTDLWVLYK